MKNGKRLPVGSKRLQVAFRLLEQDSFFASS
jgi:hypothetical protein